MPTRDVPTVDTYLGTTTTDQHWYEGDSLIYAGNPYAAVTRKDTLDFLPAGTELTFPDSLQAVACWMAYREQKDAGAALIRRAQRTVDDKKRATDSAFKTRHSYE